MYLSNEVFAPTTSLPRITAPVRLLETINLSRVVLIALGSANLTAPFRIPYKDWLEYIREGALVPSHDPHVALPQVPNHLPPAAAVRYELFLRIAASLNTQRNFLHSSTEFCLAVEREAAREQLKPRIVSIWVYKWLRAGRNPTAVVEKFCAPKISGGKTQRAGKRRGRPFALNHVDDLPPSYEVASAIRKAYESFVCKQGMSLSDSYHEMLQAQYGIQLASNVKISRQTINPHLLAKFRAPSQGQFEYQCALLRKAARLSNTSAEPPRGARGKATDGIFGPGYFEIDATFFQIQLVSSVSPLLLIGRPTVYLICDIYSGAIVGYAMTLENPSWALAAYALYNCFSDKQATFDRLSLPYSSEDWPAHHLPSYLRADRAELTSNQGQRFPFSSITVGLTPSMTPEAKGSVEGKHSELKRNKPSRFDLPGRFEKIRQRRSPDGKKDAALNPHTFERLLVEIILDINREPVDPRRLPIDALEEGPNVASRIGFWSWSLKNCPGYTRKMGENFAYEHLLHACTGRMTPNGLVVRGELFTCDRLQANDVRAAAASGSLKFRAAYHPMNASEVYFYESGENRWHRAYNTNHEILQSHATFAEARAFRLQQIEFTSTARFIAQEKRTEVRIKQEAEIREASERVREFGGRRAADRSNIRQNRSRELALERQQAHYNYASTLEDKSPPSTPMASSPQANDSRPPLNTLVVSADEVLSIWRTLDEDQQN